MHSLPTRNQRIAAPNQTRCGYCDVIAGRVDVYRGLEARADRSCCDILGDEVKDVDERPITSIRL